MNIIKLLIIALICSSFIVPSAAQQGAVGQPLIAVNQSLSHDTIFTKGSGQDPDSSTVAITIAGQGSIPRRNVDAVLVMDISNSMAGSHLKTAQSAAEKFIRGLDESRDKIGFVTFNSTLGPNLTPRTAFKDLIEGINAIQIDRNSKEGDTCLSIGLNRAIEMLSQKDAALKVIIFLSDGNNTTCKLRDNPCADAARARDLGIIIYSVGINDSGKGTEYLRCMADTTGGSYYPAKIENLNKIYQDLSDNIPEILAQNVVIDYSLPENVDIKTGDSRFRIWENTNNFTYHIGTISSNEQRRILFNISSTKDGSYDLGISPYSVVRFTKFDGNKSVLPIPEIAINIVRPTIPIPENNTSGMGEPFNLVGRGGANEIKESKTNISVQKLIMPNKEGTGPKIIFRITAPKIEKLNLVIAADSSGSTSLYPDKAPTDQDAIKSLIPKILNDLKSRNLETKVSILSWDDGVDFAYGELGNRDESKAKMKDVITALGDCQNLMAQYDSRENESTNFNVGLNKSIAILNNNKPIDPERTLQCILFITDRSEFTDLYPNSWAEIKSLKYKIYPLGLNPGPMMRATLEEIANVTGGNWSFATTREGDAEIVWGNYLEIMDEAINQTPIAERVIIVDTLYPYLNPDLRTLQGATSIKPPKKNGDGTTTVTLEMDGGLLPGSTKDISFDAPINMNLPVEVTSNRTKFEYVIDSNTSESTLSYEWLVTKEPHSIKLPESFISITSDNLKSESKANEQSQENQSGIEFGILTLLTILFIYRARGKKNE